MKGKHQRLQQILDTSVDNKKVFGTSFAIKHHDDVWHGASGNISNEQPYFIASTTKLFVTAVILNLRSKGRLNLDDTINKYLDKSIMQDLHTYKGIDRSNKITIKHLLAHTSGLPDYFEDKDKNGISLEDELFKGNDQYWSFEKCIEISKSLKPHFEPGEKKKAHYSDTNFQLLGKIIEHITGKTVADNFNAFIIEPLQLTHTYLYQDALDNTPKPLYYKAKELHIPKAMTSFGPDGGVVSTSKDMLVFIEAFFNGKLFLKAYLEELNEWNSIFFPLQSGVGIHRFKLLWIFDPFGSIPELIGHSGLSGALAYYSPKENLYIVGTVNQVAYPETSFRQAIRLVQQILKK